MRRFLLWGLGALVLVVAGVLVWARLFAGGPGPVPFIPGGALRGEVVKEPASDWSFASKHHNVDVESRARLLPYSARPWFMVHQGRIHLLLPSLFGDGLKIRIDEDPNVRVRIDGKVYEQRAVPVTDDAALDALLAPVIRRQFAIEISGKVRRVPQGENPSGTEMWIYRLEDRL